MPVLRVPLTDDEISLIDRPCGREGGFQYLFNRLRSGIEDQVLTLSLADARRVVRYATSHGKGGYQRRLRSLAAKITPLIPPQPQEPSLFKDEPMA